MCFYTTKCKSVGRRIFKRCLHWLFCAVALTNTLWVVFLVCVCVGGNWVFIAQRLMYCLSLNPDLTSWLAGQWTLSLLSLAVSSELCSQICAIVPDFYVGAGYQTSGPYAFAASTSPIEHEPHFPVLTWFVLVSRKENEFAFSVYFSSKEFLLVLLRWQ